MGKTLSEQEAEKFLEQQGFPIVDRELVKTSKQALEVAEDIGYPIAMKVYSPHILHKSDIGGVHLDIRNEKEVEKIFKKLMQIKHAKGVIIQEYTKGISLLLGLKEDPSFGHALVVGSGGIYTEIMKDVSFRVCPITPKDAQEMLQELKMYPLLEGARGKKKINKKKLCKLLVKLSTLVKKYPTIAELDINPLLVNEKESLIVDARIKFN
tara:strand:- start:49292 stop:49921 length:630 start_codon:yes stop_codon:yes gene_type:complete